MNNDRYYIKNSQLPPNPYFHLALTVWIAQHVFKIPQWFLGIVWFVWVLAFVAWVVTLARDNAGTVVFKEEQK